MRRQRVSHSDEQRWWSGRKRIETIVAGLFMVGQLLGTLHFALVHHVVCLEHGEVAHANQVESFSDWLASTAADSAVSVDAQPFGWKRSGADHQHCLVQALRRDSATRTRVAGPLVLNPDREQGAELTSSHDGQDSALFRLAPKHSPPA